MKKPKAAARRGFRVFKSHQQALSTSHKEGYSHFIAAQRGCQSPAWVFHRDRDN